MTAGGFGAFPPDLDVRLAQVSELPDLVRLDDEACVLYEQAGLSFTFSSDHPFIVEEWGRWTRAIERGLGRVVSTREGIRAAFAIFGQVDGQPYLDQLSVHPAFMRRSLGRALVGLCVDWAVGRDVWLTTYAHLPWNAPFYAQLGFDVVPEERLGADVRRLLASQRAALPSPEQRIAMRRLAL